MFDSKTTNKLTQRLVEFANADLKKNPDGVAQLFVEDVWPEQWQPSTAASFEFGTPAVMKKMLKLQNQLCALASFTEEETVERADATDKVLSAWNTAPQGPNDDPLTGQVAYENGKLVLRGPVFATVEDAIFATVAECAQPKPDAEFYKCKSCTTVIPRDTHRRGAKQLSCPVCAGKRSHH